jgi:hypothetical protein
VHLSKLTARDAVAILKRCENCERCRGEPVGHSIEFLDRECDREEKALQKIVERIKSEIMAFLEEHCEMAAKFKKESRLAGLEMFNVMIRELPLQARIRQQDAEVARKEALLRECCRRTRPSRWPE